MSAESPKLKLATDETEVASPDPFNAATLRLDQSFEEAIGVKKLLATVPVRKPHKQEWIRVHRAKTIAAVSPLSILKMPVSFIF